MGFLKICLKSCIAEVLDTFQITFDHSTGFFVLIDNFNINYGIIGYMVDLNSNGINAVGKWNNPYFGFSQNNLMFRLKPRFVCFSFPPT
jgi:hypothetical protein